VPNRAARRSCLCGIVDRRRARLRLRVSVSLSGWPVLQRAAARQPGSRNQCSPGQPAAQRKHLQERPSFMSSRQGDWAVNERYARRHVYYSPSFLNSGASGTFPPAPPNSPRRRHVRRQRGRRLSVRRIRLPVVGTSDPSTATSVSRTMAPGMSASLHLQGFTLDFRYSTPAFARDCNAYPGTHHHRLRLSTPATASRRPGSRWVRRRGFAKLSVDLTAMQN